VSSGSCRVAARESNPEPNGLRAFLLAFLSDPERSLRTPTANCFCRSASVRLPELYVRVRIDLINYRVNSASRFPPLRPAGLQREETFDDSRSQPIVRLDFEIVPKHVECRLAGHVFALSS
jgi:hypothetical protein